MNQRVTPNRGPALLDSVAGRLTTAVGAAFPGERAVFRGYDIHQQLGDMDWMELYVFGITGRRFSPEQIRMLHALWTITSYPDARIWNNRVAALAGSARSTGALAIGASVAVSEAYIYGRQNEFQAISFFIDTVKKRAAGATLDQCIADEIRLHGRIAGYGRPLANADERIAPTMQLARELGLADGPHVALAFELEQHLLASAKILRMNYGALVTAFGADLGLSSTRVLLLSLFRRLLQACSRCTSEAADKPEGTLFPTACSAIQYQGPPPRDWGK
jgi:hypothetical protein